MTASVAANPAVSADAIPHFAVTVKMTLDRETKGTYVYKADDENAAVTTMYVQKSEMPDMIPFKIKFTIETN